jgi:hypothetical protein
MKRARSFLNFSLLAELKVIRLALFAYRLRAFRWMNDRLFNNVFPTAGSI